MEERERIRLAKEKGLAKPWSTDPVFQTTYFCNVRREDDKVTKWIRDYYSPYVHEPMFLYNIILARFLNWPQTLNYIGFRHEHDPEKLQSDILEAGEQQGKIWGGAYIVSTNGISMPKVAYLTDRLMEGVHKRIVLDEWRYVDLTDTHRTLMKIDGLGSFMAAQVVADLKNTKEHPLAAARDWWTFVAPGPGSLRGASWFTYGAPMGVTPSKFQDAFKEIRIYVDREFEGDKFCNQDLQNCLCEYDKYMRVSGGTGRSKRYYQGS